MHWYFPLFTLAFASSVGLQIKLELVHRFKWIVPLALAVSLTVYFLARKFHREKFVLSLILGCGIGFLYSTLYIGYVHHPLDGLDQTQATLHATVLDYADRYEDSQRVALKVHCEESGLVFWMPSFTTMAYVPITEEPLEPGDTVKGYFSFYRGSSNGGFDRAAYYAGRNYHILASCDDPFYFTVQKAGQVPLSLRPLVWANGFKTKLDNALDTRTASFLKALLLGDQSGLSIHDRQSFQKAGLSHVMAVSGMHVGFLVGFFILVFGRRFGLLFSLAALMVFVPMAGASPSVIRAAIMYAIAALGFFLRLEYSALHSLCAALVLILLYNPYSLGSLSLQLSFLAVLGLICCGTKIQDMLLRPLQKFLHSRLGKRAAHILTGAVACSAGALLFTTPVLLFSFGYVSAASVLANLLTIGIFSVAFILGFLLCALGGIPIFGMVLSTVLTGVCAYIFRVADFTGRLTFLLLHWDAWYVKGAVFGIYLLLAAKLLLKDRLPSQYASAAACGILIVALYANADTANRRYEVTAFSCGNGQAIAVSSGHDQLAIIDCAGSGYFDASADILAYMDWNCFEKINLLVLTSMDQSHARNVPALLDTVPVEQIIIPSETQENDLSERIFALAEQHEIPLTIWRANGERPVGERALGLSLIGGTPRKLGVRIHGVEAINLLTLHSFTPKMIEEFLTVNELSDCRQLMLADTQVQENECFSKLVKTLAPEEVLLSSGWLDSDGEGQSPIRSTKTEGDICYSGLMERGSTPWP